MKEFTAIYCTKTMKNVMYYFKAESFKDAKNYCKHKFTAKTIWLKNEETGKTHKLNF